MDTTKGSTRRERLIELGVYNAPMPPKEPTPDEQELIKRGAVLIVAALIFPRMIDTAEASAGLPDLMHKRAGYAFSAAEAFVDEAQARGYDPCSIMASAAALP